MTNSTKTALIRKLTLAAGALVVSSMTLAGAADAKSNFNIHLDFGGHGGYYGGWGSGWGHGYGPVYGYGGPNCYKYWKKYKFTGKWYWKNKFYKCKAMYW